MSPARNRHLLIIALWIILAVVALKFGPSITTVAAIQNNTSSLPASAPSVQADYLYTTKFAAGQATVQKETDVLVLTDPQGISAQDIALAEQIETWLLAPGTRPAHHLAVAGPGPQTPAGAFESSDHQALRLLLTWDNKHGPVPDASLQAINTYLSRQHLSPGETLGLTGSAPINYDLNAGVFSSSGGGGAAWHPYHPGGTRLRLPFTAGYADFSSERVSPQGYSPLSQTQK
jgi:uncharacterized membrane protein YdfJ with MMPL/SSD domain